MNTTDLSNLDALITDLDTHITDTTTTAHSEGGSNACTGVLACSAVCTVIVCGQ